ncbi:uncharacterized protein [Miscanthus floridulus]|uniref:uncharacterized protein n=1 Tax=Miscanthus floridulus TaxID=154761 RepID=UPI0034598CA8
MHPLIVDPIICKKCLTKVLMDGGSGLNILYVNTLDAMRIPQSELCLGGSPFHGANFRLEVLTFEVVDFPGSYHAILGQPCYAKFMAIPNYTYLKLKMPRPNGGITMSSAFLHAFMCNHEHFELTTAVINLAELPWLEKSSTPAVPDSNKLASLTAFRPLEETKTVGIDPTDPAKMVQIGTQLPTK